MVGKCKNDMTMIIFLWPSVSQCNTYEPPPYVYQQKQQQLAATAAIESSGLRKWNGDNLEESQRYGAHAGTCGRGTLLDKQPIIELAGCRPRQICEWVYVVSLGIDSNVAMNSGAIGPYADIQGQATIVGVDSYLFMMTIMASLWTRPPHDDGSWLLLWVSFLYAAITKLFLFQSRLYAPVIPRSG